MGQKFKFSLMVSHVVAVRCWLGLQSSEGSTRLGESKVAHSQGLWLGAQLGLSKEHLHVTFPTWKSQGSWNSFMVLGFPQSEQNEAEATWPFVM